MKRREKSVKFWQGGFVSDTLSIWTHWGSYLLFLQVFPPEVAPDKLKAPPGDRDPWSHFLSPTVCKKRHWNIAQEGILAFHTTGWKHVGCKKHQKHQPDCEWASLSEVHCANRQASRGYRGAVIAWQMNKKPMSAQLYSTIFTLKAPLLPFESSICPVQILTFKPSPSMDGFPTVIKPWNFAASGMSSGCMEQCSFFFSQLSFLLSIS